MNNLFLFGLCDFDENGQVCHCGKVKKMKARSNFLYLICKYNQAILQQQGKEIPAFFKQSLSSILNEVENGGDYACARRAIVSNCVDTVKQYAQGTDKELLFNLADNVMMRKESFERLCNASNLKHQEYILTKMSEPIFDNLDEFETSKESKSLFFKDVIDYNACAAYLEKQHDEDFCATFDKEYAYV